MPEGTDLKYDEQSGRVHLANGELRINIHVSDDTSSTGSYLRASDPDRPGLVRLVRDEVLDERFGGYVVVALAKSELYPEGSYEVYVRHPLDNKAALEEGAFDCGAAAPTEELANQVVEACLTLRRRGDPSAAEGKAALAAAQKNAEAPSDTAAATLGAKVPDASTPTNQGDNDQRDASAETSPGTADRSRPKKHRASRGASKSQQAKAKPEQPKPASSGGSGYSTAVNPVIRRSMARIQRCYRTGLAKHPALEGRVKARIVIDSTGKVATVSTTGSSLRDAEAVACIEKVLGSLTFPSPAGGKGLTVVYPFDFTP